MKLQIREQQLYEDFSAALVIFRRKIQFLLQKVAKPNINFEQCGSDLLSTNKSLAELIKKYESGQIKNDSYLKILERFLNRLQQILRQTISCIPKTYLLLIISLKRIELFTIKKVTIQQYANYFATLLKMIPNDTQETKKINIKIPQNQSKSYTKPINQVEQKKQKPQILNQLDMIAKNMDLYSVINIDKQFFRARYFDAKEESFGESDFIFGQIMYRNRSIQSERLQYEKEYAKFMTRLSSSSSIQNKTHLRNKINAWQYKTVENASNLSKYSSRGESFKNKQKNNNKSYQTIQYNQKPQDYLAFDSFRSFYEEKMKQKTNNLLKVKNLQINILPQDKLRFEELKNDTNPKRLYFYKKSQDHLKYRYKYSGRKEGMSSSRFRSKYQTLNPEGIFQTLTFI